jgi:hypothetical protein
MLVNCNLHNLRSLEIKLKGLNILYGLVGCEEFKMIRRPRIFIYAYDDKIDLEESDNNIKPEDADRKYLTDVFKALPDV